MHTSTTNRWRRILSGHLVDQIYWAFVHQAVPEAETKYASPLLAFALSELYDISAGYNDLSLYSAAGFPYLFKLCTD